LKGTAQFGASTCKKCVERLSAEDKKHPSPEFLKGTAGGGGPSSDCVEGGGTTECSAQPKMQPTGGWRAAGKKRALDPSSSDDTIGNQTGPAWELKVDGGGFEGPAVFVRTQAPIGEPDNVAVFTTIQANNIHLIGKIIRISSKTVKTEDPARLKDFGISNEQFDELKLMDRFKKLRPTVYRYDKAKVPGSDGSWLLGFIAEDVHEHFPAAIEQVTLEDGTTVPAINEDTLGKIHIATTQQLVQLNQSLVCRMDAVESRVDALEKSAGETQEIPNGVLHEVSNLAKQSSNNPTPLPPQGELYQVPSLPRHLCDDAHAKHLRTVVQQLVGGSAVAIGVSSESTSQHAGTGMNDGSSASQSVIAGADAPGTRQQLIVKGFGGAGKTVLGNRACRDPRVRQRFSDGILWISVGQHVDAETKDQVERTACNLTSKATSTQLSTGDSQGRGGRLDHFKNIMARKSVLFCFDDVWEASDVIEIVQVIQDVAPTSKILLTTRDAEVSRDLGAVEHTIRELPIAAAIQMLNKYARPEVAAASIWNKTAAQAIAKLCGCLPVALAVIGRALTPAGKCSFARMPELLCKSLANVDKKAGSKKALALFGYQHKTIVVCLRVGVDALEEDLREKYLTLSVFPEDAVMPFTALHLLWGHGDADDTRDAIHELRDKSLLSIGREVAGWVHIGDEMVSRPDDGSPAYPPTPIDLTMHNLQHRYLREEYSTADVDLKDEETDVGRCWQYYTKFQNMRIDDDHYYKIANAIINYQHDFLNDEVYSRLDLKDAARYAKLEFGIEVNCDRALLRGMLSLGVFQMWDDCYQSPQELLDDFDTMYEIYRLRCKDEFARLKLPLCDLPVTETGDKELVIRAVSQCGLQLAFAHPIFQDDKDVVLTAVRDNYMAMLFVPEESSLRRDTDIIVAMSRRKGMLAATGDPSERKAWCKIAFDAKVSHEAHWAEMLGALDAREGATAGAIEWYAKAARIGCWQSAQLLGYLYHHGLERVVTPDHQKALMFYILAEKFAAPERERKTRNHPSDSPLYLDFDKWGKPMHRQAMLRQTSTDPNVKDVTEALRLYDEIEKIWFLGSSVQFDQAAVCARIAHCKLLTVTCDEVGVKRAASIYESMLLGSALSDVSIIVGELASVMEATMERGKSIVKYTVSLELAILLSAGPESIRDEDRGVRLLMELAHKNCCRSKFLLANVHLDRFVSNCVGDNWESVQKWIREANRHCPISLQVMLKEKFRRALCLKLAVERKEEGTIFFDDKDYGNAQNQFMESLLYCDKPASEPTSKEEAAFTTTRQFLYLHLVMCYIKLKQWMKCKASSDDAIELAPSAKGNCLRAQALHELHELFDAAIADCTIDDDVLNED
jgi:hypothetical protein